MSLDREICYRALRARDPRFDGRLFVGVRTTGIYCRPVCPARTPKVENVVFYPSAAAAQQAGFRPCLRCRPETSPELATWRGTANTVTRGLALIAEGALDDGDVAGLASRLGVGERQLRRLFQQHLGASPIAVAQTKRLLFAKQLVHQTQMSMADIALAAGFGSVRRFNDTFHRLYGRPPSELRRSRREPPDPAAITLELRYEPPYDWEAMFDFLRARAIPGVETVGDGVYRRSASVDGHQGIVEIRPLSDRPAVAVTIRFPRVVSLPAIVLRVRRLFDLGADTRAIADQLAEDHALAPLVRARPGLRVPGAWDGFELAVRAVLGQQITVAGARRLAGELVAGCGERLPAALADVDADLVFSFPRPERLAGAALERLGMPRARVRALAGLAANVALDPSLLQPGADLESSVARLRSLPGIGEWTAQYVAMRALREPDAFPAADLGLLRAAARWNVSAPTAAALRVRAEAWRPWRAYAAQHLWTSAGSAETAAAERPERGQERAA
jgi:AraC family transcriptional regulator, regulatory protein of adaptative response / DNA-3-methyladenine glycosylase II